MIRWYWYTVVQWKRRWFGMAPVPRYIHTIVTVEQYVHDAFIVEQPFKEAEFVDLHHEWWRDIYHCIWVIR